MKPDRGQSHDSPSQPPNLAGVGGHGKQESTWKSWLLATDHKRIALLYLVTVTAFFLLGVLFSSLMRIELISSSPLVLSEDFFNRLFTMHGLFMVFLVVLPAIPAVLGNYLLPLKIGTRNFAFPRLNLAGFYLFVAAGCCLTLAALRGGLDITWTFLPPYESTAGSENLILAVCGVMLASTSILLLGINSVVTVHKMRARGMRWSRLPMYVLCHYAAGLIMILATPVLLLVMFLLGVEKALGTGFFDPAVGGDPLLMRRLFWFWGRPALYIMILPAVGVVTEILSTHAGRKTGGNRVVVGAVFAIVALAFFAGGGHLMVSSQSLSSGLVSSLANYLVAVPFALILAHWATLMFRGAIAWKSPLVYAVGAIALTLVGGLTGLVLSGAGANVHLHGTLFVVAHFHFLLAGAVIMAYLAGLHHWWPEMTGRAVPDGIAAVSGIVFFMGLNLTFLPQLVLGSLGVPRRHFSYPAEFEPLQILSTAGLTILFLGYVLPMIYLAWSLKGPAVDREDQLDFPGSEWKAPLPRPPTNS